MLLLAFAAFFATVAIGHISAMAAVAGVSIVSPTNQYVRDNYSTMAKGSHYKKALRNVKKSFMKMFDTNVRTIKNKSFRDEFDINEIYKMNDKSLNDAVNYYRFINQQELHRIYELAKYESAKWAKEDGYDVDKTWNTQEDERVRNTKRASHVAMHLKSLELDDKFDLVPSGQTDTPANSGIPEQDINCRCYCTYEIV